MLLEQRRRAPKLDVVATQRRAAIAGDVAAGVEARRRVAQVLLDRQANKRLHAGHVDPAFRRRIAGVESRRRPGERDGHQSFLRGSLRVVRRLPAKAGEIAGKRIVEIGKVTPNDADVERAQNRLLRLAIGEEPHRRLGTTRRIGAKFRESRGVLSRYRDPMPALAARVADDDVESERARSDGVDGNYEVAHRRGSQLSEIEIARSVEDVRQTFVKSIK